MITTIANAGIPADRDSVAAGLSNNQIQDLETTRVIFFAGDAIPANEKYEMPSIKGFGGIFMPQIKTLPIENKGMIYRCKLTPLTTGMIKEWTVMLPPAEAKTWDKGFTQSNAVLKDGRWQDHTVDGFTESDPQATKEGRFATKKSGHLVYKKRYPGTELRYATRRSLPHGIGGVVEVTALKDATASEINEAQAFFFPDWVNIRSGAEGHELPQTLRETEEHFRGRIRAIPADWPQAKRLQYQQIGGAMIQSCTEYRISGQSILQKNETIIKDAATKGVTATYPSFCEFLLDFLEQKRKDDLVSGESSAVDRLARAMEKRDAGADSLELRRLEIEERKLAIEEAKLGLRPAATSGYIATESVVDSPYVATATVPINPDILSNSTVIPDVITLGGGGNYVKAVTPDPFAQGLGRIEDDTTGPIERTCGKPKTNGEPCERLLKPDQSACFQHGE